MQQGWDVGVESRSRDHDYTGQHNICLSPIADIGSCLKLIWDSTAICFLEMILLVYASPTVVGTEVQKIFLSPYNSS